jgi:tRNA 2-thiouridine synthesizing protein E
VTTKDTTDKPTLTDVARDDEGYLLHCDDWCPHVMQLLAEESDVQLSEDHLAVITFVRDYFEQHDSVPLARDLLKHLAIIWGKDKATRRQLYQLFPYGYGQQACKIAGMRKPLKLMLDV